MRKARESEVRLIMAIHDSPQQACAGLEEALNMLQALGYTPGRQVVSELVAKHAGPLEDAALDMDLLWEILQEYRAKEGFLQSEYDELCTVFDEYDIHGAGEISAVDLSNVLRGTGYKTGWDLQQLLVADIDVDGSGRITKKEFLKMVAKHHDMYVKELCDCYHSLQAADQRHEPVRGAALVSAMFTAGLLPENCDVRHLMDDDLEVDDCDLSDITMHIHRQERSNFRANAGFSPGQVAECRASFLAFDKDQSGDINDGELRALIQEVLPELARDPMSRPIVIKMLKEADVNQDGRLDFGEYLRFMSNLRNMRERQTWEKEQQAREKTGFSLEEIEEFRKIFLERAQRREDDQEHVREISLQDVMKFFGKPGDLSKADIQILADEFQAATGASAEWIAAQLPTEVSARPPVNKTVARSSMNMLWEEVRRVAELHSNDTLSEDGLSSLPSSHRGSLELSGRASLQHRASLQQGLLQLGMPGEMATRGSLPAKRFSAARRASGAQAHMPRASLPVNANIARGSLLSSSPDIPQASVQESEMSPAEVKKGADFPEFLYLMRRLIDMNFAGIALKFGEDPES